MDDFIMDHIETHGGESHARHDVDRAEPYGGVGLIVQEGVRSRNHVAEPYGGEAHEAEVEAVEQSPVLQFVEGEGSQADVHEHDTETEQNGRQDGPAVHGALGFVVGAAEAVQLFGGSPVSARRV